MLEKIKIMAIIREVDPEITIEVIKALAEEGLQSFEISLSDPELGIEAIRRSLEYFHPSSCRMWDLSLSPRSPDGSGWKNTGCPLSAIRKTGILLSQ